MPALPQDAPPDDSGAPPRRTHRARQSQSDKPASMLLYVLILAGVAGGLLLTWHGSQYASKGAVTIGGMLLVAAVARLLLPARYAGLLASRHKALDVLTFALLGVGVLAVALTLP
jgi:Protein of unknown function (DUF3017)